MTVEVYSGPGTSAWQSTRFSATVNGSGAYVYGVTKKADLDSLAWVINDNVECSWLTYGSNATSTVVVTQLSGPITSAVVYPKDAGVTQSIGGGVLTLTVPTNVRLRIEIDGDRANVLYLFASPLKATVPGGTTNWTAVTSRTVSSIALPSDTLTLSSSPGWSAGQQVILSTTGTLPAVTGVALSTTEPLYVLSPSGADIKLSRTPGGAQIDFTSAGTGTLTVKQASWSNTGSPLYFGPGVHTIGRLFDLASNVTVYLDGGAVVIGSFDVRGCDGVAVKGPGVLSGEFADFATVHALADHAAKLPYSMFYGYDSAKFAFNNTVQGITVAANPFYLFGLGVYSWRNVHVLNPWTYNTDGFDVSPQFTPVGEIIDCFAHVGDDALRIADTNTRYTVSGTFTITCNGACAQFSYWTGSGTETTSVSNCHFLHLGVADDFVPIGSNSVIKAWVDGYEAQRTEGRKNVTVTNCRVWGPIGSRLFHFAIRDYPFDDGDFNVESRDQMGQISDFVFNGITVEQEPAQLSQVYGTDWISTPHDMAFRSVTIAGIPLTASRWADYFDPIAFPYNITVDGVPVVSKLDLVNIALSHIGEGVQVKSIAPPDGSAASIAAARFWTMAVTRSLGTVGWPFSSTRVPLVAATNDRAGFGYCYDLPTDCWRVLEVLPKNAKDNYLMPSGDPIPYQCELSDDGVQRIYTDLDQADIRYATYVDDPNKWTPQFQYGFTWMLASMLVGPVVGDRTQGVATDVLKKALVFLTDAASDAHSRRQVPTKREVPWFPTGVQSLDMARLQPPV